MKKILLIKLGALGDVVRTISLAKALKKRYANSQITWVTKEGSLDILKNIDYIDKVYSVPYETDEEFDLLYNFDIDEQATLLASKIKAKNKYGFFSEDGNIFAYNLGAEYYLNTMFDDETKKMNRKSYQEMMFDLAEIPYSRELAQIFLDKDSLNYSERFIKENKIETEKLIGIHMGSAPRWPSKAWHPEKIKEFIKLANNEKYKVLLFGGPDEEQSQKELVEELKEQGIEVAANHPQNTLLEFASLVNHCKVMVCSDSLSLHISTALNKPTIALFFCTSPYETEGYEIMKKIASPLLYDFFPERMDEYDEKLTKSISAEQVLCEVGELFKTIAQQK